MVTNTAKNNDIVADKTARLAASSLLSATTITVSYFPVEITLIMAAIEDTMANNPNSSGVNILVSTGEKIIGIPWATAVPTDNVKECLINPFLFDKASR
jgi:hypothetical protein